MKGQVKAKVLKPGQVYFDYGPVSMVVVADKNEKPLTELCLAASSIIQAGLEEIAKSLPVLRLYPQEIDPETLTGLPLTMWQAVNAVGEPTLTPMAAVAGALSDYVADWLFEQSADRVIVNNGGDIAIRLAKESKATVGIINNLASPQIDRVVTVSAEDGIGGVATSGFGGRGLTRGIAQGMTVFSPSGAIADALATHMANTSFLVSPAVTTVKAGELDPNSDIQDLDVVTHVDTLSDEEVKASLEQVEKEAKKQKKNKTLFAFSCCVQNQCVEYNLSTPKMSDKNSK